MNADNKAHTETFNEKMTMKEELERICFNCGHKWTVTHEAKGEGWSKNNKKEALRNALSAAEKEVKATNTDKDVDCPHCHHFSTEAMAKHFPNGFADGLFIRYRKCVRENLGATMGCFVVIVFGVLLFLVGLLISGKFFLGGWFKIAGFFLVVFSVLGALVLTFRFFLGMLQLPRVQRILEAKSQDDLLAFVQDVYRAKNNSLSTDEDWEKEFTAFFNKKAKISSNYQKEEQSCNGSAPITGVETSNFSMKNSIKKQPKKKDKGLTVTERQDFTYSGIIIDSLSQCGRLAIIIAIFGMFSHFYIYITHSDNAKKEFILYGKTFDHKKAILYDSNGRQTSSYSLPVLFSNLFKSGFQCVLKSVAVIFILNAIKAFLLIGLSIKSKWLINKRRWDLLVLVPVVLFLIQFEIKYW